MYIGCLCVLYCLNIKLIKEDRSGLKKKKRFSDKMFIQYIFYCTLYCIANTHLFRVVSDALS